MGGSESMGSGVKPVTSSWRQKVLIEPFAVLYLASGFPMMSITSQWMIHKIANDAGVDYNNLTSSTGGLCVTNHSDPNFILKQQIQAESAQWHVWLSAAGLIPGLIAASCLSSLADKYGRKLIYISPCVGSIFSVTLYLLIIGLDLPVWFVMFDFIEHLFGGVGAVFTGSFAYVADTVPKEKLAFRMIVLEVISFSNIAIANLFVGYWIKAQGFFWPLVFVLVGKVLAMLYAIFLIPETLVKAEDGEKKKKLALDDLVKGIKMMVYDTAIKRRWKINILLLSMFFSTVLGKNGVMTMYLMNSPLCWDSVKIGYFNFAETMVMSLGVLAFGKMPKSWMSPEWKLVLSKTSSFLQCIWLGLATTSIMVYLAPLVGSASILAMPVMRFLLIQNVMPDEHASIFGLVTMLHFAGMFISNMATNAIYKATLYYIHGATIFWASALASLISLILMLIYIFRTRQERREPVAVPLETC